LKKGGNGETETIPGRNRKPPPPCSNKIKKKVDAGLTCQRGFFPPPGRRPKREGKWARGKRKMIEEKNGRKKR